MSIKRSHIRKIKTKSGRTRTIVVKASRPFKRKPCRRRKF